MTSAATPSCSRRLYYLLWLHLLLLHTPYCGYTYYYYYYCGYTYYGYTTYCGHTYYGYTTYYGYAYCGYIPYSSYTYYGSCSPSTASTHRASASMRSMRLAWRRSA